jgi:archaeal preflagellin peptidase FlaK
MTGLDPTLVLDLRVVALLAVFAAASYFDWVVREVSDLLWIVGGIVGAALLLAGSTTTSPAVLLLYGLLSVFVLQHFVPWDAKLGEHEWAVLGVEAAFYVAMIALAGWAYLNLSPGPSVAFYAALFSVLLARALFESGLLYGGADAKALMVIGILLPVGPIPYLVSLPPALQSSIIADIPFAFTALVDGALLTLVAPLGILAYNLARGEHRLPRSLYLYEIPTKELPHRFVWLKEPKPAPHPKEETTAEDEELREAQAKDLLAKGVDRVWVTPQLPFLIPLAAGAVLGILVGNVLLWFLSLLP